MHFIYILDLEDVILSDEGGGQFFGPHCMLLFGLYMQLYGV